MTTQIFKTIEIAGWLSDREVGKGKTAIWTGSEIQESCEINGPYWDDAEIQGQLRAAQAYADASVAENDWVFTPKAFVNEYNCEIESQMPTLGYSIAGLPYFFSTRKEAEEFISDERFKVAGFKIDDIYQTRQ